MNPQIDISIIIPTKNRPYELSKCLDAIFAQTMTYSFEVLVVDDHSDITKQLEYEQVISNYQTINLRFLRLDSNQIGAVAARNLAFEHCSGELIALLDDDAIPAPNWLQVIEQTFRKYPKIDAITGWIDAIDISHPISTFRQIFYEERYHKLSTVESSVAIQQTYHITWQHPHIYLTNNLSGGNSAFRRYVVDTNQLFDTDFVMMHDKEFTIRLLKQQRICAFIPDLKIQHKHTKSFRDACKKSFHSGKYRILLEEKHADIMPKGKLLDVVAPLQKLQIALKRKEEAQINIIAFVIFAFLFEYLHQFGSLFALAQNKTKQMASSLKG